MSMKKKARRIAGFTLTEMLAAVAILGILSAVAIPSIFSARKALKMTELNAIARELFWRAKIT